MIVCNPNTGIRTSCVYSEVNMIWLEERAEYRGKGRVEFDTLPCSAEGPAVAIFDPLGGASIDLDIERVEEVTADDIGLHELYTGQRAAVGPNGKRSIGIGGSTNRCKSFVIESESGAFSVSEKLDISEYKTSMFSEEANFKFKFSTIWSRFETRTSEPPHFWVLPLFNYTRRPHWIVRPLDDHPLRIYRRPAIPGELTGDERLVAEFNADQRNHMVAFEFEGEPAFIERTQDVDARQENLVSQKSPRSVTAVLVGRLSNPLPEWRELVASWKPLHLISALEFVSGQSIAPAWIELRAENGDLVSRTHASFGRPVPESGFEVIHEEVLGSTGHFLQCCAKADFFGASWFRILLHHVTELGRSHTLEELMIHAVLAFETAHRGLDVRKRHEPLEEVPNLQREVQDILSAAAAKIREIAQRADVSNGRTRDQLSRIANRTRGATGKELSLGESARDLLERFGLPDAEIMDSYYRSNPRPDKRNSFRSVIDGFRGEVFHRAYFEFVQGEFETGDVFWTIRHLHDILLRVIFKLVGYEGLYRSPVDPRFIDMKIDWITSTTTAEALGYGKNPFER